MLGPAASWEPTCMEQTFRGLTSRGQTYIKRISLALCCLGLTSSVRSCNMLTSLELTSPRLSWPVLISLKLYFSHANLSRANLSEALLSATRLYYAELTGTNFVKTAWNNAYCREVSNISLGCTLEELKAAGALVVLAPPPHVFSGTALIDGVPAPGAAMVTAMIGTTEVASTKVTTGGSYTIRIHQAPNQSFAGQKITFTVGGFSARATATWEAGGKDLLNLFAPSR